MLNYLIINQMKFIKVISNYHFNHKLNLIVNMRRWATVNWISN